MSKARVYRIKAELRMVQALRGMGQCSDAKVICVRALNRFRGDPASGRQFRDELKLCVEEQVIIFPKVLEEKVMGVN